jgi:hypothetical protein
VQVNPITFGGDVTADDTAAIGIGASIGASDSDPYLFTNNGGRPDGSLCDRNSMERVLQELYGRVPLASVPLANQCNGHISEAGELQTWSGIANPFGFKKGQNVRIQLEYVLWYFGSKGVVRENAITVKINAALPGDWFPAFDRFGPGGTDAAQWAQMPNYAV